jgi:nucleoside-diphosphate-sugar epimerase
MKKKIIVTGGSGFIGTNIIEFYKDKHEVLNLDIESPRNIKHKKYWREINILDAKSLNNVFLQFQPDYVIHMAARTDLDGKSLEEYRANVKGVENVIIATNKTPSIKKIIFASSRLVCEIGYEPKDEFDYKPSTIYGESKIIGEKIVRDSKIENANWIIVRPTSLWGPWFGAPYKNFFDIIERKLYFHPKGDKIHKKFGFVLNCVSILDALLKDDTLNKKTVYLSDFDELEVKIWADMISNCFHNTKVKQIPYFVLKIFSVLGDISKYLGVKNPPLTTFRLNNLITQMSYNTLDVQNIVKELPFTLEQGTNITYEWLTKKNG